MLIGNIAKNELQRDKMNGMSFSLLLKRAVYGVALNIKKQVLATQKELVILRHCSQLLLSNPNHNIHIISVNRGKQVSYFIKTLIQHGVSSGRIKLSEPLRSEGVPGGMWLLVAEN